MKSLDTNIKTCNKEHGFVALISILILSVVLLATTLSLAQFGLASRFFILDLENKSASEKLAEACVHIARIQVYNDPMYEVSNLEIPIDDKSCTIVSVQPNDFDDSTVYVRGQSENSITYMRVVINLPEGNFESWTELPTL